MTFIEWLRSIFAPKPAPVVPIRPPVIAPPPPVPAAVDPTTGRPADLPKSNHYESRDQRVLAQEYRYLFSICTTTPKWEYTVGISVDWARRCKDRFLFVQSKTGVPWFVVAIINIMEMGLNFDGTLLNGDPWNRKTVHYPSGRGPWGSWEEAAVYAINSEDEGWDFHPPTMTWDVGTTFYFLEAWNGFNARMQPQYTQTRPLGASPYIYSASPFYVSGKKLEQPTRFDPNLVSEQIGCMAFLRALQDAGEKLFQ